MARKPTGKTEPRRRERLSSVATAMRLLKAFSEDEVEIGISALAKRLGIAKSTVHRLAVTLVAEGMLEQDRDSGKYRLGVALFRLGALVRRRMERVERGAAVSLRAARDDQRERAPRDPRRHRDHVRLQSRKHAGDPHRAPTSACASPRIRTAEGQAILAFQPQEVVERVIARGPRRAHAQDRHQPGAVPQGARRRAPARLRDRGRGERNRHGAASPRRSATTPARWWRRSASPGR